jgi:hypothetical protein
MILHLVTFRWHDDTTPEQVAELTAALTAMAAAIPELRAYVCGVNMRLRPSPADYGVAAVVDDEDGLTAYLDSDAHAAVYERLLGPMIADRTAVQLEVERSPW